MSAAATAAGYLYASGRLRGRGAKGEGEPQPEHPEAKPREKEGARAPKEGARAPRRDVRVAVYAPEEKEKPRRTPKIQYRTRRWKPEAPNGE